MCVCQLVRGEELRQMKIVWGTRGKYASLIGPSRLRANSLVSSRILKSQQIIEIDAEQKMLS